MSLLPAAHMPVVFIGHGSPMNAIEDNAWSRGWARAGEELPWPKGIVVISAHWETDGPAVTINEAPPTIHDFGRSFPQALFDAQYPAPGSPALAARIAQLLAPRSVRPAEDWGFDHGTWSVLARMYPEPVIPVVQLGLDRGASPREHYAMGRSLAPLRDEGVLIVGSGDIVHNLGAVDFRKPESPDWARRFNEEAKRLILAGDHMALAAYQDLGEDAALSINSAEHYLPLLYVLGAAGPGEPVRFFNDEVFAAVSMTSLVIG
jgi:4,5-DOPA dioxygenase extradiol